MTLIVGEVPELNTLPPGKLLSLRTGELTDRRDYVSVVPPYPDFPDVNTWNPGGLTRDGYEFGGWSIRPFGRPIYMISQATESVTLYPVWRSLDGEWEADCASGEPPLRERPESITYTVTFAVPRSLRGRFIGKLPKPLTLVYGSELDLVSYGSEDMEVSGLYFAGWSTSPAYAEILPRICVTNNVTLYAAFYAVQLPTDRPRTHEVTFVSGTSSEVLRLNHGSVIRIADYLPPALPPPAPSGEYWDFVGWASSADEADRLFYNEPPSRLPFHVKIDRDIVLYPAWNRRPSCDQQRDTPPVLEPALPVVPCEPTFSLEARGGVRPKAVVQEEKGVVFQSLGGWLAAPLTDGVFHFRQQFPVDYPRLYDDKGYYKENQTYCEEPFIPEYEKLELVIDNSEENNPGHTWCIPTGGLSSSGASALFDWDIWVDYRYVGRFTGTSGLRTRGIELSLNPAEAVPATSVTASPRYKKLDREKPVGADIRIVADGAWKCLPFYVHMTGGGSVIRFGLGVFQEFLTIAGLSETNTGSKTLRLTNSAAPEMTDRLLQGFVFYPSGRRLESCAIELVLFDFVDPLLALDPLRLSGEHTDVEYGCEPPVFSLVTSQLRVALSGTLSDEARCVLGAALEAELATKPPATSPNLTFDIGERTPIKDSRVTCYAPTFLLSAGQVREAGRQSLFPDDELDKLKCIEYSPESTAKIIIRPHWKAPLRYGWLRAFAFHRDSRELWNSWQNKDLLLSADMHVTPTMFCDGPTHAGDYCMRYLFCGCRNLQLVGGFSFHPLWSEVAEAGREFMAHALRGCTGLSGFPPGYVEPDGFIRVGDDFKAYKCQGCTSLTHLGSVAPVWPRLTTVGHGFEASEYADCSSLISLPIGYTEPPALIGCRPFDHQIFKFSGCTNLRLLPLGFRETKFLEVGDNYLAYKYRRCGLVSFPHSYGATTGLTLAGLNCQVGMFDGCASLETLPPGYAEPALTSVGDNFVKYKFRGCSSLFVPASYVFPFLGDAVDQPGVFERVFPDSFGAALPIVGDNSAPPDRRYTFGPGFEDRSQLPINWT